jgi:hypothetical protein
LVSFGGWPKSWPAVLQKPTTKLAYYSTATCSPSDLDADRQILEVKECLKATADPEDDQTKQA